MIESANFSGNVVTGSGGGGDGAILIYRYNGNVTLKNVDVTGSGTFIENGIQIRGAATLAASGTLSFENVDVHGTFARTGVAIRDYLSAVLAFNGSVGNSALDVDVTGGAAYTGLHVDNVGGTVNLSGANAVDVTHYVPTTGAIIMTANRRQRELSPPMPRTTCWSARAATTRSTAPAAATSMSRLRATARTRSTTPARPPTATPSRCSASATTVSAVPANNGTVSDTVSAIVVGGKLATLDGGNSHRYRVSPAINLGGNGGAGDTLDYTGTTESLTVNLDANSASGFNAGAFNIENVTGSSVGDSLAGNAERNVLSGAGGDDTLKGNGGNDTLHGGAGTADTAVYDDASGNYTITYNVGTGDATVTETVVTGTNEGTDTLDGVELLDFASGDIDLNAQVLVFSSFDANTGTGTLKSSHSSIQSAVNAADGNDTVYIRNGSYTEQVNVGAGKDGLTILGQSEAGVVIHAPTTGLTFFATDPNASPVNRQLFSVVTVSGSDLVTIKNLTVDGDSQAGQVAGAGDFNGIAYVNSSGTVEDVTVREIRDTLTGPDAGLGQSARQRGAGDLHIGIAEAVQPDRLDHHRLPEDRRGDAQCHGEPRRQHRHRLRRPEYARRRTASSCRPARPASSPATTSRRSVSRRPRHRLPASCCSMPASFRSPATTTPAPAVDDVGDLPHRHQRLDDQRQRSSIRRRRGIVESGTMTAENNVVNTGGTANSYAGIATWNHEISSTSNIAFTPDGSDGPDRYRHRRRQRRADRQRRRRLPAGARRRRPDARRRRQRHHRVDGRRRQRHDDRRRHAYHRRHAAGVRHRGCRHHPGRHQRLDARRHRRRHRQRAEHRDRHARRDGRRHRHARLHRHDDGREREPRDQRADRLQLGRRGQHDRERHRRLGRRHADRLVRRQRHQRRRAATTRSPARAATTRSPAVPTATRSTTPWATGRTPSTAVRPASPMSTR